MPEDFRIQVGFFTHPKTIKLERRLGPAGPYAFLRLLGFCASTRGRTDGDLEGLDVDDIEIAAGWSGDPGAFVAMARAVGFIDGSRVHDFAEHNPWVAGAESRSERARKAAAARWSKQSAKPARDAQKNAIANNNGADADRCPTQCGSMPDAMPDDARSIENDARSMLEHARSIENHARSNAKTDSSNAPSPIPIPIPLPTPTTTGVVVGNDCSTNSTNWKTGEPISSTAQFAIAVAEVWQWAVSLKPSVYAKATRIIDGGPIEPHEVSYALGVMDRDPPADERGRPSYFLGIVDRARSDAAYEATRRSNPATPEPDDFEAFAERFDPLDGSTGGNLW